MRPVVLTMTARSHLTQVRLRHTEAALTTHTTTARKTIGRIAPNLQAVIPTAPVHNPRAAILRPART